MKTNGIMIPMDKLLLNCSSFTSAGSPFSSSRQNLSFIFKPVSYPKHHKKSKLFTNATPTCSNFNISIHKETEEILEWSSICTQISNFASTSVAKAHCKNGRIKIGDDREESEKLLEQTRAVLELPEPLDFRGIDDVTEIVRLAVNSGLLSIGQLCAVERSLKAAKRVCMQLERICCVGEEHDRFHPLFAILQDCEFLSDLANNIGFCIDCNLSTIPDRASTTLASIRSKRKKNSENLESLLKETSLKIFQAGGIDSPLVTRRRSRMCVGIKASHKSLLPEGIVLSVSSSGATYFMEPRDAIELNNMEVRLSNSERNEELAVLGFLTSEVAVSETKIQHLMGQILELELACARGAYSRYIGGMKPIFSSGHAKIDIEGIRHPLLLEQSRRRANVFSTMEADKDPVPLDIKIGHTTKIVVISGPNTGGKTVSMKTLGLASIMSKAGIFLPAKNTPKLPWFDQILADIGDHQSLEHNLSTFSGHISRLCKIVEVVSEHSLVLIDEIGSGTDPSEGVALSTSILQHLANYVNLAIVTTHYSDLSQMKSVDSRFENAAMEFCIETLQPTYQILWGSVGNSNALSIAKTIGFDHMVLNRAQEWVDKLVPDKQKERHGLLYQSLLEERNKHEAQAKEAAFVLSEVKNLYHEIHSEAADLDKRVDALKAKEVWKRQQELEVVTSQMDAVIKNFEAQLKKAYPDQLNAILRESEAAISSIVEVHSPCDHISWEAAESSSYIPKLGERVYVKGLGSKLASVVEVSAEEDTAMVQYGKIKVRVRKTNIIPQLGDVKSTAKAQVKFRPRGDTKPEGNNNTTSFSPAVKTSRNTVDLRGLRVEEASRNLHIAISACKPYGVLFVVHGTGTGAVKEQCLNILRKHPRVAKFEEESPMNYGCTVAYIK